MSAKCHQCRAFGIEPPRSTTPKGVAEQGGVKRSPRTPPLSRTLAHPRTPPLSRPRPPSHTTRPPSHTLGRALRLDCCRCAPSRLAALAVGRSVRRAPFARWAALFAFSHRALSLGAPTRRRRYALPAFQRRASVAPWLSAISRPYSLSYARLPSALRLRLLAARCSRQHQGSRALCRALGLGSGRSG